MAFLVSRKRPLAPFTKNRIKPLKSPRIESNQSCDLNNIVIMNSKVKTLESHREVNESFENCEFCSKKFSECKFLSRDLVVFFFFKKQKD